MVCVPGVPSRILLPDPALTPDAQSPMLSAVVSVGQRSRARHFVPGGVAKSALTPLAVLLLPVVLLTSARNPLAVLLLPVVLLRAPGLRWRCSGRPWCC